MKVHSISPEIVFAAHQETQRRQDPATSRESAKAVSERPSPAVTESPKATAPVINGYGLGLAFSSDDVTGQQIITVYDLETGEVVRQIPPKEVVAFLRQFHQSKGLIVSRRL
jgi:flagellar protein FlaG